MNSERILYEKLFDVYLTLIQKNVLNLFLYDKKYFISGSEKYQAISLIFPHCHDENEIDTDLFEYVSEPLLINSLIDCIILKSFSLSDILDGIHICEYDDLIDNMITHRFHSISF